jgi:predicted enzyme related to lactoylglutathione lyase
MGDPVVHFEIGGPDGEALERFYSTLFGWNVEPVASSGGTYRMVDPGGAGIGGGLVTVPEEFSYVTFYVRVDDLEASTARAEQLGATIRVPPRQVAPGLRSALIEDPGGHMVGMMSVDGS